MASDRISMEELIGLATGEMSQADAARLLTVLPSDPGAIDRLADVRAALDAIRASQTPRVELVDRVKAWMTTLQPASAADVIAELLFDSAAGPVSGYRGALAERHVMYRVGDAELDLQITAESAPEGMCRIVGQLDAQGPTVPSMVELFALDATTGSTASEPSARAVIGVTGGFTLLAPAGRYELHLSWPRGRCVIDELDVP
ncbi:MAG: hypothetical protein SFY96_11785 [Planctomycetota bacterium]|nr:hypothetical protein [Planctomycetota bacterium]